ncbi:hypothetical protein Tco_1530929 [Tanacetum coccineum]
MFKRRLIAADQASVFMAMTSDHNRSELGIQDHNNEPSSSKLVPKVVPLAVKTATSRQELELLFHHHIAMLRTTEVMKGLSECEASESNVRRIQVKDIVKEVEDYLKTYSSAGMDISCWLYKFACKLDILSSLLVQREMMIWVGYGDQETRTPSHSRFEDTRGALSL